MKKYLWIFLILIVTIGIGSFAFYNKDNNSEDSYTAKRTGINGENTTDNKQKEASEDELANFSTKLPKESKARDDNIKLACKTLNGLAIKSGETFSFWEILGCPTKEKGYKKAKAFDSDGEIIQSYGGGLCQLSTTIYNTALKVDGLKIIERHEHSRDVPYIKDGKDAAVSYNTSDLKIKNTSGHDIKIEAKVEDDKVKIKLIRI